MFVMIGADANTGWLPSELQKDSKGFICTGRAVSQMISLVKALPADKYGFAPSAAIFAPGQQTEYAGVRTFGGLVIHLAQANYHLGSHLSGLKPDIDPTTLAKLSSKPFRSSCDTQTAGSRWMFTHRQ